MYPFINWTPGDGWGSTEVQFGLKSLEFVILISSGRKPQQVKLKMIFIVILRIILGGMWVGVSFGRESIFSFFIFK